MKGLIIAAGRGSRLENLTKHTPKSLTNIGNSCFLENTIQHFRSLGVTEVGVVVGYKKEQFKKIKNVTFLKIIIGRITIYYSHYFMLGVLWMTT